MFELEKIYRGNIPWIVDNTIIFGKAGSHSYGLNSPESDFDFKGIAIPNREFFHGFIKRFEQEEIKKQKDSNIELVIYEIRKFFTLCADNNPNIAELLWLDPSDYLKVTSIGEKIIAARDSFLSKRARFSFAGYAFGQLHKIKSHRAHLLNPPKAEPKREDFGLPKDKKLITNDQRGAMEELLTKGSITKNDLTPNFLESLAKEKAYFQAKRQWDQYQEWKRDRNPVRAELEAKYGYDCKHASHLVRLMRMCKEILVTHKIIVKRPDREEILAIKNGLWAYEQLIEWADKQEQELDSLYEISTLQHEADRKYLDKLCIDIIEEFLSGRN